MYKLVIKNAYLEKNVLVLFFFTVVGAYFEVEKYVHMQVTTLNFVTRLLKDGIGSLTNYIQIFCCFLNVLNVFS